MRTFIASALVLSLSSVAACDVFTTSCDASLSGIIVTVRDSDGQLVADARVVGTNLDNGRTHEQLTANTESQYFLGEGIDGGTVRYVATVGDRSSPALEVEWHCDECHCKPESGVELVLAD